MLRFWRRGRTAAQESGTRPMKHGESDGRTAPSAPGMQTKRQVVRLTRPPPRGETRRLAGGTSKGTLLSAVYVRVAVALILIVALVFAVNQAMLFLVK